MYLYDVEVFPNKFLLGLIDVDGNKWIAEDLDKIKKFLKTKCTLLIGYNNWGYDDHIIKHIIEKQSTFESIYKLSKSIIDKKQKRFKPKLPFPTYDLMELVREGYNTKSLKLIGANLKYPYLEEFDSELFDKHITEEEYERAKIYLNKDLEVTHKLYTFVYPRIEMRYQLSKWLNIDLVGLADSAIAKATLNHFIPELASIKEKTDYDEIPLNDVVYDYIQFKTPELQQFLIDVKNIVLKKLPKSKKKKFDEDGDEIIDDDELKWTFPLAPITFNNITYTFGLGGIHSVDEPGIFYTTEDEELIDADVSSQYPRAILHNKVVPFHIEQLGLGEKFLKIFQMLVDERLKHKVLSSKNIASKYIEKGLKITINTVKYAA